MKTWVLVLGSVTLAAGALAQPAPAARAPAAAAAAPEPEAKPKEPELTLTPYGLLVLNFFYNTAPLLNADVPTAALPGDDDVLGATARQSRFGLKVDAPSTAQALGAKAASTQLEIDFFGGYFANENNTYTMAHPRLRLFFVRIDLGDVAIVAGQDWAILAPLNPLSLSHVAIPGFHSSGNLWARLPQLRAEAKLGGLELAAGVLAPTGSGAVEGGTGFTVARGQSTPDKALLPSLQARIGYGQKVGADTLGAGISGHFGAEKLTLTGPLGETATEDLTSYAAVLDVSVPIAGVLSVKGEAYYGQNIDGFFSQANATLVTTAVPPEIDVRKAYGGWGQLLVKPGKLTLGAGAGGEQVTDDGPRNLAVYGTAIYELAPKLLVGFEWDHLRTKPTAAPQLVGNQASASLHYGF